MRRFCFPIKKFTKGKTETLMALTLTLRYSRAVAEAGGLNAVGAVVGAELEPSPAAPVDGVLRPLFASLARRIASAGAPGLGFRV